MNLEEQLIILDLDFTLVNTNTTFDFLNFVCPRKFHALSKILKPAVFLNKFFKRDIYKFLLVLLCIKGTPQKLLREYSIKYYSQIGKKCINHLLLKRITSLTWKKILITASLDIIAENFKSLGFDALIASKTSYKKERLHSFTDLYGKKHKIIQAFKKQYKEIIIIEDSPEKEYYKIGNVRIISPKHICSFNHQLWLKTYGKSLGDL
jgi:phosphoserine phosphatase